MLAIIRVEVRMSASLVRCVPSVFALPPSGWIKELQEAGRWILCAREVSQPLGLEKLHWNRVTGREMGCAFQIELVLWFIIKIYDILTEKGHLENSIKRETFPLAAVYQELSLDLICFHSSEYDNWIRLFCHFRGFLSIPVRVGARR